MPAEIEDLDGQLAADHAQDADRDIQAGEVFTASAGDDAPAIFVGTDAAGWEAAHLLADGLPMRFLHVDPFGPSARPRFVFVPGSAHV